MANARGKSIDNTHLSIDQAEERGFIHRDYIAHCFVGLTWPSGWATLSTAKIATCLTLAAAKTCHWPRC
jgi:hypothetical protein